MMMEEGSIGLPSGSATDHRKEEEPGQETTDEDRPNNSAVHQYEDELGETSIDRTLLPSLTASSLLHFMDWTSPF